MHGHCPSDPSSGLAQHDWPLQVFFKGTGMRPLIACQACTQQQIFTWIHQAGEATPSLYCLKRWQSQVKFRWFKIKCCDSFPLPNLASKHLTMWGCICVDFYFSTFSALCPCISWTFFIVPLSLTQFLPWSLLGLQLAPKNNDLLCQASQSVAAKIHLPCRYFTQSFFRSLYCHPYDGCPKLRIFSLLRLHSCINFIPATSGQTIPPLSCV